MLLMLTLSAPPWGSLKKVLPMGVERSSTRCLPSMEHPENIQNLKIMLLAFILTRFPKEAVQEVIMAVMPKLT